MSIIDILWAILWFTIGYNVFQVRGIKRKTDTITGTVSVLSLIVLIFQPEPLAAIFISIFLGYFTGIFTFTIYLIGANISRYRKFKKLSPRIILYVLSLPLWIYLETTF